jgi:hypothetical protein
MVTCRAEAAKAESKDVGDATVVVGNASSDDSSTGGNSTIKAVRDFLQKSTIWRALNYGMNYDIHKVRVLLRVEGLGAAAETLNPCNIHKERALLTGS